MKRKWNCQTVINNFNNIATDLIKIKNESNTLSLFRKRLNLYFQKNLQPIENYLLSISPDNFNATYSELTFLYYNDLYKSLISVMSINKGEIKWVIK